MGKKPESPLPWFLPQYALASGQATALVILPFRPSIFDHILVFFLSHFSLLAYDS